MTDPPTKSRAGRRDRRGHEGARIAVVSGAGAGIGRATALVLAEHGYRVFGVFRGSRDGFAATSRAVIAEAATRRVAIETVLLDVRDDQSVEAGVAKILDVTGRIEVLVNVAGFGVHGPWESITPELLKEQLETNLLGAFRMCRAVVPAMRSHDGGTIVNISSDAAIRPSFWEAAYAASKSALESLSLVMRLESRQFGIRVCVVEPGAFAGTDYAAAMTSTIDWAHPDGPYADLVLAHAKHRSSTHRSDPRLDRVGLRVAELLEMDDPPFRSRVSCDPARTMDESDDAYEHRVFAADGLGRFRGLPRVSRTDVGRRHGRSSG